MFWPFIEQWLTFEHLLYIRPCANSSYAIFYFLTTILWDKYINSNFIGEKSNYMPQIIKFIKRESKKPNLGMSDSNLMGLFYCTKTPIQTQHLWGKGLTTELF